MSTTPDRRDAEDEVVEEVPAELPPIEPEAIHPVDPNVVKPDPNAEDVETPEQQRRERSR